MKQDNARFKAQSYSHGPRYSVVLFDLVPSCQVSRFQRPHRCPTFKFVPAPLEVTTHRDCWRRW